MSEAIFPLAVPEGLQNSPLLEVEFASKGGVTPSLLVPRLMAAPSGGKVPLVLTNPTEVPLFLTKTSLLFRISAVSIDQVSPFFNAVPGFESLGEVQRRAEAQCSVWAAESHDPKSYSLPEHLSALFGDISERLSDEQLRVVKYLLNVHADAFSKDTADVGCAIGVEHAIVTWGPPIRVPYRRLPVERYPVVREELERLRSTGIIRPSTSSWSAPIVLVKKKTGDWRMCIDYRALNAVTEVHSYPLPVINQLVDTLRGNVFFSLCDIRWG
jgi:hypothetical protein